MSRTNLNFFMKRGTVECFRNYHFFLFVYLSIYLYLVNETELHCEKHTIRLYYSKFISEYNFIDISPMTMLERNQRVNLRETLVLFVKF